MNFEMEQLFESAPQEIKEKGLHHHKCIKRLKVAEKQAALWDEELRKAKMIHRVSEFEFQNALTRYDTESKTMRPDEKIKLDEARP